MRASCGITLEGTDCVCLGRTCSFAGQGYGYDDATCCESLQDDFFFHCHWDNVVSSHSWQGFTASRRGLVYIGFG